jgi:hypothetical protein
VPRRIRRLAEKTGARFLPSGYKLSSVYECRGTSLIGAANLSPVTKLGEGTGAMSRYKLSRSQKFVKVQDFICGQMRVSGCNGHYESVLSAGVKVEERSDEIPPWRGKKCDKQPTFIVRVMVSF